MTENKPQTIHRKLSLLPSSGIDGLKQLFWEELNYDHANSPIPTTDWDLTLVENLAERPVLFATAANEDGFHIIYSRLTGDKMPIGRERALIQKLIVHHPHSLFVFSNQSQTHWHFVNAITESGESAQRRRILRRISVSQEDRLRTASERLARLDVNLADRDLLGLDPVRLQNQHEAAFDVEEVTREFFQDYQEIFHLLSGALTTQNHNPQWAHDFALQFLNRLMFLYYIERKRWLGNDPDFLHNFWRAYKHANQPKDTFVSQWLEVLVFEAFNKKFSAGRSDVAFMPQAMRDALQLAPWLNGGLFTKTRLDTDYPYCIDDALISQIFAFLDRYNFTISEDTPLDQEVAVDPEMIGKVYESLVNVSSEADDRGDAGIFYTPRIEIDLMCRLSLVDWLSNHLPHVPKANLYEFVFAFSPEDKAEGDQSIESLNLWPQLDQLLSGVAVLDPACGSGSFLVGMLMILDDLLARCTKALGKVETPYERRKRIVGASLYGVDIMEWAVHVAELRLWLQLVIETDIDPNELQLRPLLPNLSFNIRRGDSLVQEIGGLNFGLRRAKGQLRTAVAEKITALKTGKLDFYNNKEGRKYIHKEQIEQDERFLFKEILEEELRSRLARLAELQQAAQPTRNLFGEVQDPQMKLDLSQKARDLEQVNEAVAKLRPALEVLKSGREIPFVWDLAFVEIFEGDKGGFDIVVGNPPYVRQEKIHDPALSPELVTPDNKQQYKQQLALAVYSAYPHSFGFKQDLKKVAWSLDKKSDLYIYFYFIGLSLLNEHGSFCFITSNSWLDVGYGADLQRFLLTRGKVKLILDNQVKRSFKSADVNTIIALLSAPQDSKTELKSALEHAARFVMIRVPFESGLSAVLWEEVEEARERKTTPEMRIVVKPQRELLSSGMDAEKGTYAGDKWGGKYLRAPDLYWKIIDSKFLVPIEPEIGEIKTVSWSRLGLNSKLFTNIHDSNSIPVIKSPRDSSRIILYADQSIQYLHFKEIESKHLLSSPILWDDIHGNKHLCRLNIDRIPFAHNFHGIKIYNDFDVKIVCALLNSTLIWFFIEILGRKSLGGGAIRLLIQDLRKMELIINPNEIPPQTRGKLIIAFDDLAQRDVLNVEDEIILNKDGSITVKEDRKTLDEIIFNYLGLTQNEKFELYKLTLDYAKMRSNKSKGDSE